MVLLHSSCFLPLSIYGLLLPLSYFIKIASYQLDSSPNLMYVNFIFFLSDQSVLHYFVLYFAPFNLSQLSVNLIPSLKQGSSLNIKPYHSLLHQESHMVKLLLVVFVKLINGYAYLETLLWVLVLVDCLIKLVGWLKDEEVVFVIVATFRSHLLSSVEGKQFLISINEGFESWISNYFSPSENRV